MKSLSALFIVFIFVLSNLNHTYAQTQLTKCPKHYMLLFNMDISKITKIANNPDFEGMQLKLDWKSIEPQKDNFNFTLVDSVLNIAQSYGKKIVFQFQYKTFQGNPPIVPDYLLTDSNYQGGVVYYPDSSSTAKLWITAVTNRLDTVFQAMGNHFGNHPALEGINLPETATYIAGGDYNLQAYINGIKADIAHSRAAFPNSVFIIQFLNWLPGSGPMNSLINNLRIIADYTTTFVNTGFGGPDNKIQTSPNPTFTPVMTFQNEYDGLAVLGNATQWNDYNYINPHTSATVTTEEILQYSVDSLKDDYIFWLEREPNFTNDVIPTLELYRGHCTANLLNIAEVNKDNAINIFPNPTNGNVNIHLAKGNLQNVKVYTLTGEFVREFFSPEFSVSDLADGFYFIVVQTDKTTFIKKLIKQ